MANLTSSLHALVKMPPQKWVPAVFHSGLTLSLYETLTYHNQINSIWTKSPGPSPSFFSLYILFQKYVTLQR